VAEATALYADHPDSPLLTSEHATTHRLLTELPASTWAHFACHATSSSIAPSQAGLRLQDGVLSVPDISRLNLVEAELAYLSACSTAHSGWYVADESTSLDSAFHLAGFRHVISSLWPLSDRIAAIAARSFYQHLPDTPDADQAAATLHRVVRELRAEHPERPDLWAPLVHSGP
jgi:CHAT domain-containing protein